MGFADGLGIGGERSLPHQSWSLQRISGPRTPFAASSRPSLTLSRWPISLTNTHSFSHQSRSSVFVPQLQPSHFHSLRSSSSSAVDFKRSFGSVYSLDRRPDSVSSLGPRASFARLREPAPPTLDEQLANELRWPGPTAHHGSPMRTTRRHA